LEIGAGRALLGPPVRPAGEGRVGRIALQMERLLVDVPVDDLVAPVVVEIGQQHGSVRHRHVHVAVDRALGGDGHGVEASLFPAGAESSRLLRLLSANASVVITPSPPAGEGSSDMSRYSKG